MLVRALARLRREQEDLDRGREFASLEGFLTGEQAHVSYREVAERLGTTKGAVKTSIHRLRRRLGRLVRSEIAETVTNPSDVDDEVRHLLGMIAPWCHPRA